LAGLVLTLAVAPVWACATQALAARHVVSPTTLSAPTPDGTIPQVAVNPHGEAVVVWSQYDPAKSTTTVQAAATASAHGGWTMATDLGSGSEPAVALSPKGRVIVVWSGGYPLQSAIETGPSPWRRLDGLSGEAVVSQRPQIEVDASGEALATWTEGLSAQSLTGTDYYAIGASALDAETELWLPPFRVTKPGEESFAPMAALSPTGDAVLAWQTGGPENPAESVIKSSIRPVGGSWQAPVTVSMPRADSYAADVATDAAGDSVAVWWTRTGSGRAAIQAAIRPVATGAWSPPVDLSATNHGASGPSVAMDEKGDAFAVWGRYNGHGDVVEASVRPAHRNWEAPRVISCARQDAGLSRLAVDAKGDAIAVWVAGPKRSARAFSPNYVQATVYRAGEHGWQSPIDLSSSGGFPDEPQVGIDEHGDGVVAWGDTNIGPRRGGERRVVQAAKYFERGSYKPAC
jgi:hypothetical protein